MRTLLEATRAVERGLVLSAFPRPSDSELQRKCEEYAKMAEQFPEFMDEAYFGEAIFKSELGKDHDVAMEVAEIFWWALRETPLGKGLMRRINSLSKEMASFWRDLQSNVASWRSKTGQ
jgi:hypothetical protein